MHKVAINFEDGFTCFVDVYPGDTLADAAYKSGINIPLDCGDGACGTCRCYCETGAFEMNDFIEEALSAQDANDGFILACCAKPTSDCVIAVPAKSEMCLKSKPKSIEAFVKDVEYLSSSTALLRIEGEDLGDLSFLPGQYVNLKIPGTEEERSYSFCSLINGANETSFLVRLVDNGVMGNYLRKQARPDDRIEMKGPFGAFYLRAISRPILMIAGGTGLAPFISMLEDIELRGIEIPIELIYGVTDSRDLVQVDVLNRLAERIKSFNFITCVANASTPSESKGVVTDFIYEEFLNNGDVDVYLCGPPPMVEAVKGFFEDINIRPKNLFFEKFSKS